MQVLGIEPKSSGRVAPVLNHTAVSLAQDLRIFKDSSSYRYTHSILTISPLGFLPPTPFILRSLYSLFLLDPPSPMLPICTRVWGSPPFGHIPKENDPFPSRHPLPVAPHRGGALGALPSLCLSFAQLHLVQVATSDRALECTLRGQCFWAAIPSSSSYVLSAPAPGVV